MKSGIIVSCFVFALLLSHAVTDSNSEESCPCNDGSRDGYIVRSNLRHNIRRLTDDSKTKDLVDLRFRGLEYNLNKCSNNTCRLGAVPPDDPIFLDAKTKGIERHLVQKCVEAHTEYLLGNEQLVDDVKLCMGVLKWQRPLILRQAGYSYVEKFNVAEGRKCKCHVLVNGGLLSADEHEDLRKQIADSEAITDDERTRRSAMLNWITQCDDARKCDLSHVNRADDDFHKYLTKAKSWKDDQIENECLVIWQRIERNLLLEISTCSAFPAAKDVHSLTWEASQNLIIGKQSNPAQPPPAIASISEFCRCESFVDGKPEGRKERRDRLEKIFSLIDKDPSLTDREKTYQKSRLSSMKYNMDRCGGNNQCKLGSIRDRKEDPVCQFYSSDSYKLIVDCVKVTFTAIRKQEVGSEMSLCMPRLRNQTVTNMMGSDYHVKEEAVSGEVEKEEVTLPSTAVAPNQPTQLVIVPSAYTSYCRCEVLVDGTHVSIKEGHLNLNKSFDDLTRRLGNWHFHDHKSKMITDQKIVITQLARLLRQCDGNNTCPIGRIPPDDPELIALQQQGKEKDLKHGCTKLTITNTKDFNRKRTEEFYTCSPRTDAYLPVTLEHYPLRIEESLQDPLLPGCPHEQCSTTATDYCRCEALENGNHVSKEEVLADLDNLLRTRRVWSGELHDMITSMKYYIGQCNNDNKCPLGEVSEDDPTFKSYKAKGQEEDLKHGCTKLKFTHHVEKINEELYVCAPRTDKDQSQTKNLFGFEIEISFPDPISTETEGSAATTGSAALIVGLAAFVIVTWNKWMSVSTKIE